jgi:translation initiation factor 3 subunit L
MCLYRELYYRHIYSLTDTQPTLKQRIESWENYCSFFNYLLSESNYIFFILNFTIAAAPGLDLELPKQWLWDMIDEFIYQFQSFCQYRTKLKNKNTDELTTLANNPQVIGAAFLANKFVQVWNVTNVINFLQSFVTKSDIIQVLEREKIGVIEYVFRLYRLFSNI